MTVRGGGGGGGAGGEGRGCRVGFFFFKLVFFDKQGKVISSLEPAG